MTTPRCTRRRRRSMASASGYIIPTILLFSTLGGLPSSGPALPVLVLASEQTYTADETTNDQVKATNAEGTTANLDRQRPPSIVYDESSDKKVTAKVARTLQIRSAATSSGSKSSGVASSVSVSAENMTLTEILAKAARKGLGGGIPGLIAGFVQVATLM